MSRNIGMEEMTGFKFRVLSCKCQPWLLSWEDATARIQSQSCSWNFSHRLSSTLVQCQYHKFRCRFQCCLLATGAEPPCYGMDTSPSQPAHSGLDSNTAWLETYLEKEKSSLLSKEQESGHLWNDPESFRMSENGNYYHTVPQVFCLTRKLQVRAEIKLDKFQISTGNQTSTFCRETFTTLEKHKRLYRA